MSNLNLRENIFPLPSQGKAYDWADRLINGDSIKVRSMTVGDQRHLSSNGGDPYQIYYTLLNRLVVEPKDLIPDDMLIDDINAILFAIRILSFGDDYDLQFTCLDCGMDQKHSLKLSDLEVTNADEKEGYDPNTMQVKVGEHTLTLHSVRLSDEKAVVKQMKNLAKVNRITNENSDRMYVRYAQLIDLVDGQPETFFQKKMDIIDNMSIPQLDTLAEQINDMSIGVVPVVTVACKNTSCGYENEVRVGVSANFFRSK